MTKIKNLNLIIYSIQINPKTRELIRNFVNKNLSKYPGPDHNSPDTFQYPGPWIFKLTNI